MNIENKEQFKREAAYMLTAYNKDYLGISLNINDLENLLFDEYLHEDDKKELIEEHYNDFIGENEDSYHFHLDEFEINEFFAGSTPMEIINVMEDTKIDWNKDYFRDSVYGLEFLNEEEIIQEGLENKEFKKYIIETYDIFYYYLDLDEKDLKEIMAIAKELITQGY